MALLADAAVKAGDPTFQGAALAAFLHKSRQVLAAGVTEGLELPLALSIVRDPLDWKQRAAWLIASDESIASTPLPNITDAMMLTVVDQIWPFVARLLENGPA